MDLYDADWPDGLFDAHLNACRGRLPRGSRASPARPVRAHGSVDAGIRAPGGLEAGRRIAEICMGGLGQVQLTASRGQWPITLSVTANDPVLACLASQYAGWSLSSGTGKTRFHALGSGPARALA